MGFIPGFQYYLNPVLTKDAGETTVCFHGPCQAGGISKVGGDPIDRNCNSSPLNTGRPSTRGMMEPNGPIVRISPFSPLARHSSMAGDGMTFFPGIQAGQPTATPCFKIFDRGAWKSGETSGVQTLWF
jgi:hypothetical protein